MAVWGNCVGIAEDHLLKSVNHRRMMVAFKILLQGIDRITRIA